MSALPRLRPRVTANGPPAADLFRDGGTADLDAGFQAAYGRARLRSQRTLIRLTCTLATLFAGFRGADQALNGFWHPAQPIALISVLTASAILAVIVWTRAFERIYLPFANVLVPARNVVAAAFIAGAAARGQQDALMFLPLMVVGPFFLLGLTWRAALLSGISTCLSFSGAAVVFALELPAALRAGTLMGIGVIACAIAARQIDGRARKDFVESNRISELARHDSLTGLQNRGVFDEQLSRLWRRAVDGGCTLAIFLIDVDHFKAFNDRYGHQAGDRALRRVAQTLERLIERPLDVLARYGGEEFAVILYDADAREAESLAEEMRFAVGALDVGHRGQHGATAVTISIGAGFVEPSSDRQPLGALQLADQALYEAKRRGRNCVVLMDQDAHRQLETGVFASFARGA